MDTYIGKVLLVELPGNKRAKYKWFVRLRDDGRYIVRSPKIGVSIKDLSLLKESDYGKEILLPIGSIIRRKGRKSTRKIHK